MTLETIIDGLSRDEQIIAMEMLWKKISEPASELTPPEWHTDIVLSRVAAVKNGDASLVDWKDAKKRLAERLQ